ncbi:MAG: hypothetical protein R3F49_15830 [Planctomycetota bacterium]
MQRQMIEREQAGASVAALPDAERAGRDVLLHAVRFPRLLFVVFGLIALHSRMRGGDKPIELDASR